MFAPFIDLFIHLGILLSALTNVFPLPISTGEISASPRVLLNFFLMLMLFAVTIIILLLSYLALWQGYIFGIPRDGIMLTRIFLIGVATISLNTNIHNMTLVSSSPFNLDLGDWSKYLSIGFSALISIYLAIWAPSAIFASRNSPLNTPYSWALAPITVIFFFTKIILWAGPNRRKEFILMMGLILFGIGGLIALLVKTISPLGSTTNTLANNIYYGYSIIGTLISGGMFIGGGFIMGLSGLNWIKGWIRWQGWLRHQKGRMSYQDFFTSLENIIDNAYFCIRFIRTVRERNLLNATPEAEFLLKELALALEYGPVQLNKERGEWSSFEFWLEKYFNKKRSSSWNSKRPEILDEICILLDQVYANNRGSKVQVQSNSLIS